MRDLVSRKENLFRAWQEVFEEWKAWIEAEMDLAFSIKPKKGR